MESSRIEDTEDLWQASDPDELKKIREQRRSSVLERQKLASDKFVSMANDYSIKCAEYSFHYGSSFLKMMFTINAGAIASILVFVGGMIARSDTNNMVGVLVAKASLSSIVCFMAGVVFVIISSGCAYINWAGIEEQGFDGADSLAFLTRRESFKRPEWLIPLVSWTSRGSVLCGVLSLFFWLIGSYKFIRVLSKISI